MTSPPASRTELRTLLLTDLVDSTALTSRLGDRASSDIYARLDRAVRDLLPDLGGREVDRTDGYFLVFERPIAAVRFSLELQEAIAAIGAEAGVPLATRTAIHLGELVVRENTTEDVSRGARPVEMEGLAKPIAARVMSLGCGGQTLLTRAAFDLARRAALDEDAVPPDVRWLSHGPYALKGVEEPIDLFEVGRSGHAPLQPPPDSAKARSVAALDADLVGGWRPSPGASIPSAPGWIILDRLGEGGFGEVWRVRKTSAPVEAAPGPTELADQPVGTEIAFKFCFDLKHARALRREATLFRLIQKKFGHHRRVVRLVALGIDEPPLFLAMEYIAGKNLSTWLREEGSEASPTARLQMMAPIAETIAELHEAGVLLNDIKPSNILIRYEQGGGRQLLLTDLGIGTLRDKSFLEEAGLTRTSGFTKTALTIPLPGSDSPSTAGTLLYLAPELFEGKPSTVASDVYAFGVTLLQTATCDPRMAVSDRWARLVRDKPTRRLLARLLRGDPVARQTDMRRAAKQLRSLRRRIVSWRIRRDGLRLAVVALALLLLWREVNLAPARREEANRLRRAARDAGVPTSVQLYNRKHAPTRAGEAAIARAVQMSQLLTKPSPGDWAVEGDMLPIPTLDLDLLATYLQATTPPVDFTLMGEYVDSNREVLRAMHNLVAESATMEALSWRLNLDVGSGSGRGFRAIAGSGWAESFQSGYVVQREAVRYLMPAAVWEAATRNDTDGAWSLVSAWRYMNSCLAAEGNSLVSTMIGVAVEGILVNASLALLAVLPPSKETALRHARDIRPVRWVTGFGRAQECERLLIDACITFLAGAGTPFPQEWGDAPSRSLPLASFFGPIRIPPKYPLLTHAPVFLLKPEIWRSRARLWGNAVHSARYLQSSLQERREIEASLERMYAQDILLAYLGPGFSRAGDATLRRAAQMEVVRSVLVLHAAELDARAAGAPMPERLDPLFEHYGLEPPRSGTGATPAEPILYDVDRELGVFILRYEDLLDVAADTSPDRVSPYVGVWGERTLQAVAVSVAPPPAPPPALPIPPDESKPKKAKPPRNNYEFPSLVPEGVVWTLALSSPSGREISVVAEDAIAQLLDLPGRFPPGTAVRLIKRPALDAAGKIVFVLRTTRDLAVADTPTAPGEE